MSERSADLLVRFMDTGTLRIYDGRVQMLRQIRCGDCGHRHVSTYSTCEENVATLCSDCGVWPTVDEINAAMTAVGRSITCPVCSMTSYHPEDIAQRYCGNCHQFHEFMAAARTTPSRPLFGPWNE